MKLFIKGKKTWIVISIALLCTAYYVYAYTKATPVMFITMKAESYKETFLASGILQMDNGILVKSEVDGTVKSVVAGGGQTVKKGDVLAVLENQDVVLRLEGARSEYRKAQAVLAGTGYTSEQTQVLVLDQLKLELEKLGKEKSRFEQLAQEGAISDSELEAAQHDYTLKQVEISRAESRLKEIRNDSAASLSGARSSLELQLVGVRQAELDVQRLTVKAPFDGVVIRSDLRAGESVRSGDGIVFMAKSMDKYCEIQPDEKYLPLLKTGQSVSVYADQAADKPVTGQISWISSEIEKDTGTVKVRIRLLEDRPWLIQNMLLRCEVLLAAYPDSLVLPAGYIVQGEKVTVLTEESGRAVEKTITTNGVDTGKVRILSGLKAGERVMDPTDLKAGERVTLMGEGAVEE